MEMDDSVTRKKTKIIVPSVSRK